MLFYFGFFFCSGWFSIRSENNHGKTSDFNTKFRSNFKITYYICTYMYICNVILIHTQYYSGRYKQKMKTV